MDPVSDFVTHTLMKQSFKSKKDKKHQQFEQEYKKSLKTHDNKPKPVTSTLNAAESDLSVERRKTQDRRQSKQKQPRFDLRTKQDRRQNSSLSLKI